MQTAKLYITDIASAIKAKMQDYSLLVKFRLSATVVFSSVMAYAIAAYGHNTFAALAWLYLGGFLVTGSANALNEVLEKDLDKLMMRTENRPLATGRMSVAEGILAAGVMGSLGIVILWYFFNPAAALLGAVSLILYSFVYTPLKRMSPIAVFVGAIPGAMSPLIGWVAATNEIGPGGIVITAIQFLWQFPHFWSIAWIAQDDYLRAGFKLLPSQEGRGKFTALQNIIYIVFLIPVSLVPFFFLHMTGPIAASVIALAGLMFLGQAIKLFRTCEMKDAKKLMFMSIIYLPVVMIALLTGRI